MFDFSLAPKQYLAQKGEEMKNIRVFREIHGVETFLCSGEEKECFKKIVADYTERNEKSYYWQWNIINDRELRLDYGSWSIFYKVYIDEEEE